MPEESFSAVHMANVIFMLVTFPVFQFVSGLKSVNAVQYMKVPCKFVTFCTFQSFSGVKSESDVHLMNVEAIFVILPELGVEVEVLVLLDDFPLTPVFKSAKPLMSCNFVM